MNTAVKLTNWNAADCTKARILSRSATTASGDVAGELTVVEVHAELAQPVEDPATEQADDALVELLSEDPEVLRSHSDQYADDGEDCGEHVRGLRVAVGGEVGDVPKARLGVIWPTAMIIANPRAMNITRRNGGAIDQKVGRRSSSASSSGMSTFSRETSHVHQLRQDLVERGQSRSVLELLHTVGDLGLHADAIDGLVRLERVGALHHLGDLRDRDHVVGGAREQIASRLVDRFDGSGLRERDRAVGDVGEARPSRDVEDRGVGQELPHPPHDLELEGGVHRGERVVEDEDTWCATSARAREIRWRCPPDTVKPRSPTSPSRPPPSPRSPRRPPRGPTRQQRLVVDLAERAEEQVVAQRGGEE